MGAQPDILVNTGGVYEFLPLDAITPEHFHKQFNLNMPGLLPTTQEAVKPMGRTVAHSHRRRFDRETNHPCENEALAALTCAHPPAPLQAFGTGIA
jgi:NAD(P)-dependent dehydrogenase (short-subunit alcohol dehydrogenase family)